MASLYPSIGALSHPNSSSPAMPAAATDFTTAGIVKASAVAVLIIIAIVGNLLVFISFVVFRNLRSLTNYFIVSLSIADFLIASCTMPIWFGVQLHDARWPRDVTLNRFWYCMDMFLCLGSVLSLTAISVERSLAITNPFCYTKWLSPTRVVVSIACLWFYAMGVSTITTVDPFGKKSDLSLFIVISSFFLPLLILFIMYTKIFTVARRQARRLRQDGAFATDMKAIKTIAIVVGAFIVCYTPYFVVIIWVHFNIRPNVAPHTVSIAKWLTYLNSCLNPIIYSCFNKTYRKSFKRLFKVWHKKLQEFRQKMGAKKTSTPRSMQRSQMSLNVTMRGSAGSLLDGPKTSMDMISLDGQTSRGPLHATHAVTDADVNTQNPQGGTTGEQSTPQMETST